MQFLMRDRVTRLEVALTQCSSHEEAPKLSECLRFGFAELVMDLDPSYNNIYIYAYIITVEHRIASFF